MSIEELEEKALNPESDEKAKQTPQILERKVERQSVKAELQSLNETLQTILEANPILSREATLTLRNSILTREAADQFIKKFEDLRREDQDLIVKYLTAVTKSIALFVQRYQQEIEKMTAHREREKQTLDLLDSVLKDLR